MYNNLLGRVGSIAQTYYSDLTTWQAAGTPRVRNFIFHEYGFFLQDVLANYDAPPVANRSE